MFYNEGDETMSELLTREAVVGTDTVVETTTMDDGTIIRREAPIAVERLSLQQRIQSSQDSAARFEEQIAQLQTAKTRHTEAIIEAQAELDALPR